MGVTNTGTRSNPQAIATGVSPTFAADMDAISDFFAARSLREFTTVALMVSSTGSAANEWAKADNAPGAMYYSDGTRWHLGNQPTVANASARNALFNGTLVPDQGDTVTQTDTMTDWMYFAAYNSGTNPGGAKTAGWYPVGGVQLGGVQARSATAFTFGASAFDRLTAAFWSEAVVGSDPAVGQVTPFATNGGWVSPLEGVYRVDLFLEVAGASTNAQQLLVKKNDTTATAAGTVLSSNLAAYGGQAFGGISAEIVLAAGDILYAFLATNGTPTIGTTEDQAKFGCHFVRPRKI